MGFVFQHFGLLETLTAAQNVELAGTLNGTSPAERRRRALELLDAVGLAERAGHRPSRLSGGERQRVAIARALVNEPRLLLADEPTGNLDDDASLMVIDLLEKVRADHGCTLVMVTHNRELARRADQRIPLDRGHRVPVAGMKWRDAASMAATSIRRRFGRSVLTVAAVALAATLLTALVTIAGTARTKVLSELSKGGPLSGITVAAAEADPSQVDTDDPRPAHPRTSTSPSGAGSPPCRR